MNLDDNKNSPADQNALYSQRAADFHGLVRGSLRDRDALDHYRRLVRRHGKTSAIIDIGCGTGDVLNDLSTELTTTRLVGTDIVDDMLAIGRKEAKPPSSSAQGPTPEFILGDMHNLSNERPELGKSFDLVISRWAYHHSLDLGRVFQVTRSLLKPNGWHVFLSNVVYSGTSSCPFETYKVQLQEDFAVTNYTLTLHQYLSALAESRFMITEVALYAADHKIVQEPRVLWYGEDGLLSVRVFTGVFAAQLVT
ncbi:MAG: class I SAM-dependent methyltransferase [Verrucomicrobiota bacterium]